MFEKIKFWMISDKNCNGCCILCSHYEECRNDVMGDDKEIPLKMRNKLNLITEKLQ